MRKEIPDVSTEKNHTVESSNKALKQPSQKIFKNKLPISWKNKNFKSQQRHRNYKNKMEIIKLKKKYT